MADELLERLRDVVEGEIDFKGQASVEAFATLLLAVTAVVAFNVGVYTEDIRLTLYFMLGGAGLTFLATMPPWPIYKRNPLKWQPVGSGITVG